MEVSQSITRPPEEPEVVKHVKTEVHKKEAIQGLPGYPGRCFAARSKRLGFTHVRVSSNTSNLHWFQSKWHNPQDVFYIGST